MNRSFIYFPKGIDGFSVQNSHTIFVILKQLVPFLPVGAKLVDLALDKITITTQTEKLAEAA